MSQNIVDDVPKGSPRAALLFLVGLVGFFAFLAWVVPPMMARGVSTDNLFYVVMGALLCAVLLPLVLNMLLKAFHLKGKKPTQLLESFVGFSPTDYDPSEAWYTGYSVNGTGRELVPMFGNDNSADDDESPFGDYGDENEDEGESQVYDDLEEEGFSLVEQDSVYLAEHFQPAVNPMLSECMTVIGIRRSGKSNMIAVLCEELSAWEVPLVLADTEDEYGGLARPRWMPRGVLAGSPARQGDYPGRRYFAVNIAGAYEFGKYVLEHGLQVVLNLKSYANSNEAAYVMVEIVAGMNDWQEARANRHRVSCMFILDEAQYWLPQDISQKNLSKEALTMLQTSIFDTMVNRGGKRGLGLVLGAQKPAQLDKRALQSKWKFLFRQTERIELKEYAYMGIDEDDARYLQNGECFVFSPVFDGMQRIQMRRRNSPDESQTPGLASVLAHRQRLVPIDQVAQRSFAVQSAQETSILQEPSVSPVSRQQSDLEKALEAYDAGNTTQSALALALGISPWTVRPLYAQVKKLREQAG